MKSVILCEGGTDLTLVQYYMEKALGWNYDKNDTELNTFKIRKWFSKLNGNKLLIGACGGVRKIPSKFEDVLDYNVIAEEKEEAFEKIIILTDRDEYSTVEDFNALIKKILKGKGIVTEKEIYNNTWCSLTYLNEFSEERCMDINLLVIPFEERGALETFLLNALSENDKTDKKVIFQCNKFIDNIDTNNKYLNHRRLKVKAKFDVFFSVRTPLEQFQERRSILRNIEWEKYSSIQTEFRELEKLG